MKKQNGFKTWFAGLKGWQRFILIIAGLVVFSIIGSIAESDPVEDTPTKQEDSTTKSNDKSKAEKVDQETVEKEVEQETTATEETEAEQEDYTSEPETDLEQSEEEYFNNMESYFEAVGSAGRALSLFGEELTTGEITPAAESHIQRAADEMDIASYLISEEGMVNEVPDNLKAFHEKVLEANQLYVDGIAEMKDGTAASDINALESGLQKISEANELSAELKNEMEV